MVLSMFYTISRFNSLEENWLREGGGGNPPVGKQKAVYYHDFQLKDLN